MKRLWIGVLALACGGAFAQDWKSEWEKTVAAAKKEGALVIGIPSSAGHREFVQSAWARAYPEIALSQSVVAGGKWVTQVKVERSTGKYLWDLAITGTVVGFQMKEAQLLDPLRPEFIFPDIREPKTWGGWDSAFFDKDGQYVLATRSFLKMPFFNAKLLDPAKVRTMGKQVFLSPDLKQRIVWHDPTIPGSGESFAPVMRRLLGDEGFKTFIQDQVVFVSSAAQVVERTARGQFAVALGPVLTGELESYRKAGVPLDIRPLGNTPELGAYGNTGGSNMILLKNRPHPNAARVFINWFLSRDFQTVLSKSQLEDSRRTDVPPVAPADERRAGGARYFEAQREEHSDELQAALQFVRDNRRK